MNLETKITIYKFTPQVFTLTPNKGGFSYNYLITFRCNAANFGNEVWQHLKQWCFKVAVI